MAIPKESSPTYHSNDAAAYVLPNDAAEQDRLNLQHKAIVAMMKGQPFTSPLTPLLEIALDIGCGTGATTLSLANFYPDARKIHGVDLTPVPTATSQPFPANVMFTTGEIRDLVQRGVIGGEGDRYGFVFSRMLFLGMTDWAGYIKLLYGLLELGGWAELQEVEFGAVRNASGGVISQNWRWLNSMRTSLASKGLDIDVAGKIPELMREAGFVDVGVKVYVWSWSLETWEEHKESSEIGRYSVEVLREDIGRMKGRLWDGIAKDEGEIEELYGELREGLGGLRKGTHMRYYAVCGRRP